MSAPRMVFEVICDVCRENEKHMSREARTTLTYRLLIAGRLDQIGTLASSALHGKFMTLLRVRSMQRLRKAKRSESEGWIEIEQLSS